LIRRFLASANSNAQTPELKVSVQVRRIAGELKSNRASWDTAAALSTVRRFGAGSLEAAGLQAGPAA
jgi:hypothetical protein